MKSMLFGALVLCGAAAIGCGSSSGNTGGTGGTGATTTSTTAKTATSTGSKTTSSNGTGPGSGGAGGGTADNTAGKLCTKDSDCDVTMMGATICNDGATQFFTNGTLNPSFVCQPNMACDPGTDNKIHPCDGTAGICLDTGTPGMGLCLGACEFDGAGNFTTPCAGKNVCNVDGYGTDANNMTIGVGFCLGGCLSNADCTVTGEQCNPENLLCETIAKIVPSTKTPGTPCVMGDTACTCASNTMFPNGFCITSCKVGQANECGTGFECSAELPTTGMPVFTAEPNGIGGTCLKTCTADTDCLTGTGATHGNCYIDAGHTNKTCHLGPAQ